jgi:hypothetical protein
MGVDAVRDPGRRCAIVRRRPGPDPMHRRPNGDRSRRQDRGRRLGRQPPVPSEISRRPGLWVDLLEPAARRRVRETGGAAARRKIARTRCRHPCGKPAGDWRSAADRPQGSARDAFARLSRRSARPCRSHSPGQRRAGSVSRRYRGEPGYADPRRRAPSVSAAASSCTVSARRPPTAWLARRP